MPELEEQIEDQIDAELPEGNDGGAADAPVKPTPTATPSASDDVKTALAELSANITKLATPKPEPAKQLTPEEQNQAWAVFEPEKADPKFFHKMFNLPADTAPEVIDNIRAAFGMMQNGLMKQAVVGAMKVLEQKFGPKLAMVDELQGWRTQSEAQRLQSDFHASYPALADEKYTVLVNAAAKELENTDFKDFNEYKKALAERAGQYIKSVDPSFDLGAAAKPTKPTGKPGLPRTRVGGTGGTGGGGKPQQAASDDDSASLEL